MIQINYNKYISDKDDMINENVNSIKIDFNGITKSISDINRKIREKINSIGRKLVTNTKDGEPIGKVGDGYYTVIDNILYAIKLNDIIKKGKKGPLKVPIFNFQLISNTKDGNIRDKNIVKKLELMNVVKDFNLINLLDIKLNKKEKDILINGIKNDGGVKTEGEKENGKPIDNVEDKSTQAGGIKGGQNETGTKDNVSISDGRDKKK